MFPPGAPPSCVVDGVDLAELVRGPPADWIAWIRRVHEVDASTTAGSPAGNAVVVLHLLDREDVRRAQVV